MRWRRERGMGDIMVEQSGPVRVRVVVRSIATELEDAINRVLTEELASGAELVDIKLTSVAAPPRDARYGSVFGEHVAVIILRSGTADS